MKKESPIKIDGDLIIINATKMETGKLYPFEYKGEEYRVWKNEEGEVTLFEVLE